MSIDLTAPWLYAEIIADCAKQTPQASIRSAWSLLSEQMEDPLPMTRKPACQHPEPGIKVLDEVLIENEQKENEKAIIGGIGQIISSSLDIDEVYERFAIEAGKLISFDSLIVSLPISHQADTMRISYVSGMELPGRRKGDTYPLAGSLDEVAICARTGVFIHLGSIEEVANRHPLLVDSYKAGVRSMIISPLIARAEVIGCLHFLSKTSNAYTQEDLCLAQRIGDQIAGAIANAQLFTELKRSEQEIATIAEIGRIIGSTLNVDDVYERFAIEAGKLIPFDRLSVALYNGQEGTGIMAYVAGMNIDQLEKGETFSLAGSLIEMLMRSRAGFIFHPKSLEECAGLFPGFINIYNAGLRSMITVPLISDNMIIGGLHFRSKTPNVYTQEDLRLAQRIGDQIAGAIANAQLFAELKREEKAKALIAELGRTIGSSLDIEEVYKRFAVEVYHLVPYDRFLINLKQPPPHDGEYKSAFLAGKKYPRWRAGNSHRVEKTATGAVLKTRIGMILQEKDAEKMQQYPRLYDDFKRGIRSTIVIPLISMDEVIGVILFMSQKPNAYTEEDLHLAERVGIQIAPAIANAQLFTDLKKAGKSLQESEALFRAIFEQAAVGVAEIDIATSHYLRVNRRHCEIFSMTEEEMLSSSFPAVTHPEDSRLFVNKMTRMMERKIDSITVEMRCLRKDGVIIWVNVAASPLWKRGEDPKRNIIVIEDITERKNLELELRNTLETLEVRVRERTIELEEINTALGVLLKKRENDKKNLEEILQTNVDQLVMPFLHKLQTSQSSKERMAYLNILETNLNKIVSPLINRLSAVYRNLTPKEIQIAELIKQGRSSKEIAELFNVSVGTVITHRNHIRQKLNIKSKDVNLRSQLLLIENQKD